MSLTKSCRRVTGTTKSYRGGATGNLFQPIDNTGSYGPKMQELPELPHISTYDCLPEGTLGLCAHPETTTETMLDGSTLIRCLTCRYSRVTPAERS